MHDYAVMIRVIEWTMWAVAIGALLCAFYVGYRVSRKLRKGNAEGSES